MTVSTNNKSEQESSTRQRAKKYIPHLAEFYFKPTYNWSIDEARTLYENRKQSFKEFTLDSVHFEECIGAMKRLPKACANLIIADPPFGLGFDGKSSVYNRNGGLVIDGYTEAMGSYEEFAQKWIREFPRIMRRDASAYVFSGWTNLEAILSGARKAGLSTLNHIVWHYPFGVYTKRRFVTSHYHILLLVKDSKKCFYNKLEHYPEDVWDIKRKYYTGLEKNGTKLPAEVVSRCIDFSSRPGDIVLDPFMGNGTTAVAAKGNWRHFLGFEINDQLRSIIHQEIKRIKPGEFYKPYIERIPSIEELAELYPRAYREYLRRQSNEGSD